MQLPPSAPMAMLLCSPASLCTASNDVSSNDCHRWWTVLKRSQGFGEVTEMVNIVNMIIYVF